MGEGGLSEGEGEVLGHVGWVKLILFGFSFSINKNIKSTGFKLVNLME